MAPLGKPGAIVMAAGAGRRMGGKPKSLLLRNGTPLIERHLRALAESDIRQVVVVLGHHAERIEPALHRLQALLSDSLELRWAVNAQPDDGPGSSLRVGLAALSKEVNAVLVALADQPLVEALDVADLLRAWEGRGSTTELVVPSFEGQPGHPLIFSSGVREEIMRMSGNRGLRDWRKENPDRVEAWPVDHARYTLDVDSEDDIAALRERCGVELEWPAD